MVVVSDYPHNVAIDASFILTRLLPDEKIGSKFSPYFRRFAKRSLEFVAPRLLCYEVANALRSAVLQKRIEDKAGEKLLTYFLTLPIRYIDENFMEAYRIAIEVNISIYDAVYVWLARKERLPLLSLDGKLARASERNQQAI